MIIDITHDNTPITTGERPGDAPKTCGCGGKGHGQCGHGNTSKSGTTKTAQTIMMCLIALAIATCYFLYS